MPSLLKLTNNAVGRLASNRSTTDTSLILQAGEGVRFPSLAAGEFFRATLVRSSDGAIEIVNVTARSSDTLTVTRAQEGTAALAFLAGDRVELRLTSGSLQYSFDWLESYASNASNLASGVVPADRLTGTYNINAATAAELQTARTIGGVAFNGTANINLPGVNAPGNQNTTGNAATVTNGVYTTGGQTIAGVTTFGTGAVANAAYGTHAFEYTGNGGGPYDQWNVTRGAALQVAAPDNTAAYNVWRVTKWGARHLAAMDVYAGGSDASLPEVAINIAGAAHRRFVFYGNGLFECGSLLTVPVLNATAGAGTGWVGTYALLRLVGGGVNAIQGNTFAGSNLEYSTAAGGTGTNVGVGTWRAMGQAVLNGSGGFAVTIFMRIA